MQGQNKDTLDGLIFNSMFLTYLMYLCFNIVVNGIPE